MNTSAKPLILPIQILNVRAFLLRTSLGFILVDTGIPYQERNLLKSFQNLDVNLDDIKAIFLTHDHLDHIGCLPYLQERTGSPVICHHSLADALAKGSYEEAVPRVPAWKLLNKPLSAFLGRHLKPVAGIRGIDNILDLSEFGLNGSFIHTPGHSPGSCSILLESGAALIGDLLRERSPGVIDTGLFYHDRSQILASLEKIASFEPELIFLSHGTTITGEYLKGFIFQAFGEN